MQHILTLCVFYSANVVTQLGYQARRLRQRRPSTAQRGPGFARQPTSPSSPEGSVVKQCKLYLSDQLRAVSMWSPDFIPLASPLITAAIVGSAAAHSRDLYNTDRSHERSALDRRLLELVLSRYAEHWAIGSFFLGETLDVPIITSFRIC